MLQQRPPFIQKVQKSVEVARVIPHERNLRPAGEGSSVRERVKQFEIRGLWKFPKPSLVAGSKTRAPQASPQLRNGTTEQATQTETSRRSQGEFERALNTRLDDIMLEMRDVKSELPHVRELLGILVLRERCAETKTEIAARRLDRMEREKDEVDNAEHEVNLQEALADKTKVVKLVVDNWFVDKGVGFGKAPTGEIVFIHATVAQGAEVLMIGTDAWAQVVSEHARAEGGYRARRAWGRNAWRQERDKEKANRVA